MPDFDLIIRGAQPHPSIGIADGVIVTLADVDDARAREVIDATGLLVMPGVVDAHVHFNEPGRTDWEGWATGSRAAVAGGTTTVFDMPLNSTPPVVTVEAFDAKRAAAEAQSVCDFALWGGLVPGFVDRLDALFDRGVVGFKAFMAHSGIDDFPKADLATLKAGMERAYARDSRIAVHAEFDRDRPAGHANTARQAPGADAVASGESAAGAGLTARAAGIAAFLSSRPIESECDAIRAALDLAGETGCALHVVHVSSARGLALITEAKARGVDVTAETCPHYLVFTDEDLDRLGAVAKCAPPLRPRAERDALLARVLAGDVDTLGSDHSPSPWAMKAHDDFSKVWGGIAGAQHLLPLALETCGGDADLVARLTAFAPAARFGFFGRKGRIEPGYDADLTLIEMADPSAPGHEISAASLLYRHPISPYVGRRLRARVRRTVLRGRTVFADGRVVVERGGRLLTRLTPSTRTS